MTEPMGELPSSSSEATDAARRSAGPLRERVLAILRAKHRLTPRDGWLLMLAGVAMIAAPGFVLSAVLSFLGYMLFETPPGFAAWFCIYLLLVSPVLVLEARRSRHGFFTFAAVDVDLRKDPDDLAELIVERARTHARSLIELLLWGPRALFAGLRAVAGWPQEGLERILPEAADVLTRMLTLDKAAQIKALADPGVEPLTLMPVLKWLDAHDYIGFSTRGDRVWVSSPAKAMFAQGRAGTLGYQSA